MYNEEKKLQWIDDAERRNSLSNRRVVFAHLNRLSDAIETPLGADLFDLICANRKSDVIREGNARLDFSTYSTLRRFVQTVNAYLDWRFAVDCGIIPSQEQRLGTYEFSLVDCYAAPSFIKTEERLSSELSHHRIEDGDMLSVFASMAWIGYTPKEMIAVKQNEVHEEDGHIVVCGAIISDGFVNDTLMYYNHTVKYYRPPAAQLYIKEDGEEFLRNIVPASRAVRKANMLTKLMDAAYKTELLSGDNVSYARLAQAGTMQRWLEMERNGVVVDADWIKTNTRVSALTSRERAQEFEDFKTALGI